MSQFTLRLTLCFLALLGLLISGRAVAAPKAAPLVYTLDISQMNTDEKLTAVCLEGLANRQGAHVFLLTGNSVRWMQWDNGDPKNPSGDPGWFAALKAQYPAIGDYWVAALTKRRIYRFQPITMGALIQKMRLQITGWIRCGTVDDDVSVAATMAGLRSALPMTSSVYAKYVTAQGATLPMVFDITGLYAHYDPKDTRRIAAHRWMIAHLLLHCDNSGAVSRNKTYGLDLHDTLIDVDLAVQHRWAVYDLNYLSAATKNPGDKPDPRYGFDLPDRPLIDGILAHLKPWSPVYGWGSPDENNTVNRITRDGCVLICTGGGNGSFFRWLPRFASSWAEPDQISAKLPLEKKIYVAFMVNEGDTLKYASSFEYQSWLEPERGALPINWGVDPLLYAQFPGLMSYYYATATPNDYFFAATSGWGYTHPEQMTAAQSVSYAAQIHQGLSLSHTSIIDIWWDGGLGKRLLPFFQQTGAAGITQWSDHQAVEYSPLNGMPIVDSNDYYTLGQKTPAQFAAELVSDYAAVRGPWFVVVYGGTPYQFEEIARSLPADKFVPVTLDHFFALARAARAQVAGRVFTPADAGQPLAAPGAGAAPVR